VGNSQSDELLLPKVGCCWISREIFFKISRHDFRASRSKRISAFVSKKSFLPLCRRACPEGLSEAKESNGPARSGSRARSKKEKALFELAERFRDSRDPQEISRSPDEQTTFSQFGASEQSSHCS